jgi:hypothetical protein
MCFVQCRRIRFQVTNGICTIKLASTDASGKMASKWRASTVALGSPTSARVATACRFSDDSVTWQSSS